MVKTEPWDGVDHIRRVKLFKDAHSHLFLIILSQLQPPLICQLTQAEMLSLFSILVFLSIFVWKTQTMCTIHPS
jgi:hypothetical protein